MKYISQINDWKLKKSPKPKGTLMKSILLFLTLFTTFSTMANSEEFYETPIGSINLTSLESIISHDLKEQVDGLHMHIANNPYAYISNWISDEFLTYSFEFTIRGKDKVSCDFTIILNENKSMISKCSSKIENFSYGNLIPNSFVGLPNTKINDVSNNDQQN